MLSVRWPENECHDQHGGRFGNHRRHRAPAAYSYCTADTVTNFFVQLTNDKDLFKISLPLGEGICADLYARYWCICKILIYMQDTDLYANHAINPKYDLLLIVYLLYLPLSMTTHIYIVYIHYSIVTLTIPLSLEHRLHHSFHLPSTVVFRELGEWRASALRAVGCA